MKKVIGVLAVVIAVIVGCACITNVTVMNGEKAVVDYKGCLCDQFGIGNMKFTLPEYFK